jgi:hypothetical protein
MFPEPQKAVSGCRFFGENKDIPHEIMCHKLVHEQPLARTDYLNYCGRSKAGIH